MEVNVLPTPIPIAFDCAMAKVASLTADDEAIQEAGRLDFGIR
jgi:hypothetical protein